MKTRTALDGIDAADLANYVRRLSEMRPDLLDVVHMNNESIEPVRDSVLDAEANGTMPRQEYRK
jgi:hypothetical protein